MALPLPPRTRHPRTRRAAKWAPSASTFPEKGLSGSQMSAMRIPSIVQQRLTALRSRPARPAAEVAATFVWDRFVSWRGLRPVRREFGRCSFPGPQELVIAQSQCRRPTDSQLVGGLVGNGKTPGLGVLSFGGLVTAVSYSPTPCRVQYHRRWQA